MGGLCTVTLAFIYGRTVDVQAGHFEEGRFSMPQVL